MPKKSKPCSSRRKEGADSKLNAALLARCYGDEAVKLKWAIDFIRERLAAIYGSDNACVEIKADNVVLIDDDCGILIDTDITKAFIQEFLE